MFVGAFTDEYLQGDVYTGVTIVTGNWREDVDRLGRRTRHFETLLRDDQAVVVLSHSCDMDPRNANNGDDVQVALLSVMGTHDRKELQKTTWA
jgi:hypothetical protein